MSASSGPADHAPPITRQEQRHRVPLRLEGSRQRAGDVRQAPGLGEGNRFRRDEDDIHPASGSPRDLPIRRCERQWSPSSMPARTQGRMPAHRRPRLTQPAHDRAAVPCKGSVNDELLPAQNPAATIIPLFLHTGSEVIASSDLPWGAVACPDEHVCTSIRLTIAERGRRKHNRSEIRSSTADQADRGAAHKGSSGAPSLLCRRGKRWRRRGQPARFFPRSPNILPEDFVNGCDRSSGR